jgi:hypothetical protein
MLDAPRSEIEKEGEAALAIEAWISNWPTWERTFMDDCSIQEMRDRMASSMANLMANDPDWRDQAWEIWEVLSVADIHTLPEGETPKEWCQSLFRTPGMASLAETMIERGMEPEGMSRALYIIEYVVPTVYLGD